MKKELLNKINEFKLNKSKLVDLVKKYVQDKNFSLDDRWNLFIESEFGGHRDYIVRFNSCNINDLFYLNRYKLVYTEELIELMEDKEYDINQINSTKEEILEKFIKSFTYDW